MIKSKVTLEMKNAADIQLKEMQKQIEYDTRDLTVELLVQKFKKGEFFIPAYQRQFIWKPKNKDLFIESVLLGLPIPFMFFGDCEDGKMEVIDGAQRMQTLVQFVDNKLKLKNLEKLPLLKGFSFEDLPKPQQRKFLNKYLRVVILDEDTTNDVRQDLFNRINTRGEKANDSEIRRGSYPGKLSSFIEECSKNEKFITLCPIPEKKELRYERFELILRFFAYTNNYLDFVHDVNKFLDEFLIDNMESFDEEAYKDEFINMLNFVEKNFPNGFAKTRTAKTTPRVRFEAISVGVALALREKPQLEVDNINWIESSEFKEHTTTDASNNQGKLRARVEFVRDKLLMRDENE
nr:DUF262 domain-containing protein [Eubacteriales bacterium]